MLRGKQSLKWLGLLAAPLLLVALWWGTYPFADVIADKTLSTSQLSADQKSNIALAAQALDGTILKPGEQFSFNKVVGPRSTQRGYRLATSYLGPENPSTVGGGICLVSSIMYQVALESGLPISERSAHLRTIRTVPAGFDATVWYGQADLKFRNDKPFPVQIQAKPATNSVNIALLGRKPADYQPSKLTVDVDRRSKKELVVELFRRRGNREERISRDYYVLTQ